MAHLLRQYLCCCFPSSHDSRDYAHDDEHQPLLNPDILPQAPPRPVNQRTTEQHLQEQETLRRILNLASERLISISSPAFFLSPPQSTSPSTPSRPSHSPRSSSRSSTSSTSTSTRSSGTLTPSHSPSRRPQRSKSRRREERRRPESRADGDAPLAPLRARVVTLGEDWRELASSSSSSSPAGTTKRGGGGGGGGKGRGKGGRSRPPSSHSMRTLPRNGNGGGAVPPSPLRDGGGSDGEEEENGEYDEDDEHEADESKFDTLASYRTASSGRGTRGVREGYPRLSEVWHSVDDGRGEEERKEGEEEWTEEREEALTTALSALERSIDDWKLPGDLLSVVAELEGGEEERK
ncbi:hypothetical protein JCM8547_002890 [Rhodosporidiobolus lusitaniae]